MVTLVRGHFNMLGGGNFAWYKPEQPNGQKVDDRFPSSHATAGARKTVCSRWRSARLVDHSSLVCPACLLARFENFLCVLDGVNSGREGRVQYDVHLLGGGFFGRVQ